MPRDGIKSNDLETMDAVMDSVERYIHAVKPEIRDHVLQVQAGVCQFRSMLSQYRQAREVWASA